MTEMINPYIAGAPVVETRMFFGREDVFNWIQNSLTGQYTDHTLVIHGQRRVGKTSVLKQLGNRLPKKYVPVFFDLQGRTHTTLDRFLWWLSREIVRVLKQDRDITFPVPEKEVFAQDIEYFEHRFLPDLRTVLGDNVLLLTFDEFDNLEENEIKEELSIPLVDYLRRLMGQAGLNFIFSIGSSGRKLENMQASYTDFFKTALYKKISFLSRDQTADLITRPVEGLLEYHPQAVARIYDITSGHPYFTQLICHELFSACQQTGDRSIQEKDVEAVLEDVVERGTVNLKFVWDEASDIEKWSLASLAHLEGKADTPALANFLRKQRLRFSESDLTSGLLRLREKDILTEENRFVIYLLKLWLKKNRPIEQVREELTEVNPIANRYLEIGMEFKDAHVYDKALECFKQALAVAPEHVQTQVNIALVYMDQNLYDKAIVEFEKALTMDDEEVSARSGLCEAHLALGDAAMARGRAKEATLSYQRVLAINLEHTDARGRMADLSRQRAEKALLDGKDEEALSAFAEALKFTPEDPTLIERVEKVRVEKKAKVLATLLARSEKEAATRNWEGAVRPLEEALSLAPADASIQKNLSEARFAQEKARLDALLARADLAVKSARWDEAIETLTAMLAAKPDQAVEAKLAEVRSQQHEARLSELKTQAQGLARLERFDEALVAWGEYLALEPADHEKAQVEIEAVKKAQALADSYADAQKAYSIKNYDQAVSSLKGIINQDENYKDASRLLSQAIELRRTAPRWWQNKSTREPGRIQKPKPGSATKTGVKRIWMVRFLLTILFLGVAGALAWLGNNNLPAISALFTNKPATKTIATTPTFTPEPRIINPDLYVYIHQEKTWHDARDFCADAGGYLITIQDEEENNFIYHLTNGGTWLGATDEVEEGTWVWVSGESWEYTEWAQGQPGIDVPGEERDENYLTFSGSDSYWSDQPEKTVSFVCEWDPFPQGRTIIVASAQDSGPGTLRQALSDAQAGDTITFDPVIFPPDNPATIYLTSGELPRISQGGITIDASNAGVSLNGSKLQLEIGSNGLVINSDHNTVMGLLITQFGSAIYLEGGSYNMIGGDRSIGAGPVGQGNLISDNYSGIGLLSMAGGNVITGNLIGTDVSGAGPMGNWKAGIWIEDNQSYHPAPNIIGPDNLIAFNGTDVPSGIIAAGVGMDTAETAMTITGNSIYDNAGPGIFYNVDDAVRIKYSTPPVILHFDLDSGVVNGQACIDCIVEIFSTETQDGKIYEGTVTADGYGNFSFSKGEALTGPFLTATATRAPGGNTSEFSPPTPARSAFQIALDAIQNEAPVYQTSFDTWDFGEPEGNARIESGKLIVTSENDAYASANLSNLSSDRFAVEFDLRILESGPEGHCSFLTKNNGIGESWSAMGAIFFSNGQAGLGYFEKDKIEDVATSRYDGTKSNTVMLIILGDQIAAFINGQIAYTALNPGGSTVYNNHNLSGNFTIACEYDNFKLWDLSGVDFSASTLLTTLVPNFANPILAAIKDREPDFQDDFSGNSEGWRSNHPTIESGVLRESNNSSITNSYFLNNPNFVLQVDISPPPTCCVLVRASSNNMIYLSPESWGICRPNWSDCNGYLRSWSETTKIQIMVIVKGTQAVFYLQGIPVAYIDDSYLGVGETGFSCSDSTCEFDNVKFWDLDKIPDLP